MFSLHETTRRHFCQMGFVALCLLPTLGLVGGAYWLRTGDYRRRHEAALSERFGVPVTLARVTHPTPTSTRYERFEILDPETRGLLARAEVLTVDERGTSMQWQLAEAEISSVFLGRLRNWVEERLCGSVATGTKLIQLAPCKLTVHYPDKSQQRFVELSGKLDLTAKEPIATLACQLEDSINADPLKVRFWRDRRQSPARSGFDVSTGGPVPCSIFAPLAPAVARLGNRATIDGSIWAVAAPAGWEGACEGSATLKNVNLDALVTNQLPHHLTGMATVELKKLTFRRNRLDEIQGSIVSGPGLVSYSLLDAAAAETLAVGVVKTKKTGHALSFEELSIQFSLDQTGFTLDGQCHGVPDGTMLAMRYPDREQPVPAATSTAERHSLASLVRVLSGKRDALLPASAEAQSLARLLPIMPGDKSRR